MTIGGDEAVQRHDMPSPEPVAVIAPALWTGVFAEIVVIGSSVIGQIIVVARRGPRSGLVTSPARLVALLKLLGGSRRIRVIADGEHRAGNLIEQPRGRDRARAA